MPKLEFRSASLVVHSATRVTLATFVTLVSFAAMPACSSSTDETDGGTSDGGTSDAVATDSATTADASSEAAASTFKSCTNAELDADDHLATGADVSFVSATAQYTTNCIRIKVGKDVGFYGPFDIHPLAGNGESGNPVPSLSSGTDSGRITFPTAGTYGFHCTRHAATMYGTIKVVP